jgi:glycosyltransferase 2 family protein
MTEDRDTPRWRKRVWIGVQIVLFAAAVAFFVRLTRGYWDAIASVRLSIRWTLLLASSLTWAVMFALLVRLWGRSLRWWEARPLPLWSALRVFVVSNLARYVPGTIWQFAGLAAMALTEGVSPISAASAALLQQVALLVTGALLTITLAPGIARQWASGLPSVPLVMLIAGGAVVVAVLAVMLWRPLRSRLSMRLRGRVIVPDLRVGSFPSYLGQTTVAWLGYGLAFWMFGRALFGEAAPSMMLAGTAYIASYVAGIIAVFAPGGIVVRETALIATIGPAIGPERALVLALASRIWLVALEIVTAGIFFGIDRGLRHAQVKRFRSLRP